MNRFTYFSLLVPLLLSSVTWAKTPKTQAAEKQEKVVTYEAFGAVGDGIADDLPAICRAHEYANKHQLPVRSNPKACYHLGTKALSATITTDTDWSTSRFIIDDSGEVEDNIRSLFLVRSQLKPVKVAITKLVRDQKKIALKKPLQRDCYVLVEDDSTMRFIRRGLNPNDGHPQRDAFILRRDGSIACPIDWDYEKISSVEAYPIDDKKLVLRGGVFTTIANRVAEKSEYSRWARNISVTRSNTEVVGLKHLVTGETEVGHPYHGFLQVENCANITLRECFATGRKTYRKIGTAGKPVSMGTYGYTMYNVVNFTMKKCTMKNIFDHSLWGITNTSHCKNILIEDCKLSRVDVHRGVSGDYTIRRSTLGCKGLNAIGRGKLTVEDSTLHGHWFINFRNDYGATWNGEVLIRNCRWLPVSRWNNKLHLFDTYNNGKHNFGYCCYMPQKIIIDGLFVDDSARAEKDQGLYLFSHIRIKPEAKPPFPYVLTKELVVRNLTTKSGKKFELSPDPLLREKITVQKATPSE